jgi:hypothetical protein
MGLVLSFILVLLCVSFPWSIQHIKERYVVFVFFLGLLLSILGAAFSIGRYPWTDIIVFSVAVSGGQILGRFLSSKFWTFLLLLLILSALDITQVLISTHIPSVNTRQTSEPVSQLYGNFLLMLPSGRYNIGIFDLLLITSMSEYWLKRGSSFQTAVIPGIIGTILAYSVLWLLYDGALPLIPFLTIGWIVSFSIYYYRNDLKRSNP